MRRIASHFLLDSGRLVRHPLVTLSDDGTVTRVEFCENPDGLAGVEFHAGTLLPPLLNAHCHLELSHLKGKIPENGGFAAFAQGIRAHRDDPRANAAAFQDAKMWQDGVGECWDIANSAETDELKTRSKIRYRTFREIFGFSAATKVLPPNATPHSLYSLLDAAFKTIASHGRTPLSIHFMETPAEAELYRGKGDLWNWYEKAGLNPDFLHYGSPVERLIASVPRERELILVHNTCVDQAVIDRIMSYFDRVTWVLCPRSNVYISGLRPPAELLLRNRLDIRIGTDSLASNHSLSLIDEIESFPEIPLEIRLSWLAVPAKNRSGVLRQKGLVLLDHGVTRRL